MQEMILGFLKAFIAGIITSGSLYMWWSFKDRKKQVAKNKNNPNQEIYKEKP
jgi:hypothetical protein